MEHLTSIEKDFVRQELDVQKKKELMIDRTPRVYVASLSDYNAGLLHGQWIDAAQDEDALANDIHHMLSQSPHPQAEEWAVHDYDGFYEVHLAESESLTVVSAVATGIAEHGPAFAAWAAHVDNDLERLGEFDEAYQGSWPSMSAFAENLIEEFGIEVELDRVVSESMRPYINVDYDALARDFQLSGDYFASSAKDGSVEVFHAL